jgi:predicted metal-dependent peptidase
LSNCKEAYSEAVCALLVGNPFFYHWMQQLVYKETEEVQTAAVTYDVVGEAGRILVNPKFFTVDMPLNQRVFIIEHELLHWIYSHPFMSEAKDKNFNLAADLAINSLLDFQQKDLLAGAITPKSLAQMIQSIIGVPVIPPPEKASSLQYYEWIKMLLKLLPPSEGDGSEATDGSSGQGSSQGSQGQDQGNSGGGSSGQAPQKKNKRKPPNSRQPGGVGSKGLQTPQDVVKSEADRINHDHWHSSDPQTAEHAQQRLAQDVSEAQGRMTSEEIQKHCGSIRGELEQILKAAKKAEIPWHQKLKKFVGVCGAIKLKATHSQCNKYGMPPKVKMLPGTKILVMIDTSGSMSDRELSAVLAEVEAIHKQGVGVDILQFDYEVQDVAPFKKRNKYKIYGRGGTDFVNPFKWLKANYKRQRYSGCIVLTDGYAAFPSKDLVRVRTTWVVTNEQAKIPDHCGQVIRLKLGH